MTTLARVTQLDVQPAFGGTGNTRVTEANAHSALDIQAPVRFTQISLQVALAYVNPRVTQVNAFAAVRRVEPVHVSAHIEVL